MAVLRVRAAGQTAVEEADSLAEKEMAEVASTAVAT